MGVSNQIYLSPTISHTFLFFKSYNTFHKINPEDMEAQLLLFGCNGSEAEEIWKESKGRHSCVILVAMMVVCLSFLGIFTVPMGLQKEVGLAGAREAMESVEFKIFVVMDALSFFSSLGVVLALLQAMAMENNTHIHMSTVMCKIVVHIAMGSAAIAFLFAAATFTKHLY